MASAAELIDGAFAVTEYAPGDEMSAGPLSIRFCEVPHFVTTYAVELAGNGSRFTFGADCRPNDSAFGESVRVGGPVSCQRSSTPVDHSK